MIKVLRLMQYEFENVSQMENTFGHGAVPLDGIRRFGTSVTIRSTSLVDPFSEPDDRFPAALHTRADEERELRAKHD